MRTVALFLLIICPVFAYAQMDPAPLTAEEEIVWSHAPYEMGECSICHENADPAAPGPVLGEINDLCFTCHGEFRDMLQEFANIHPPVEDTCTDCHNPHNSRHQKLLNVGTVELCVSCHDDIGATATGSTVKHAVVTEGKACLTCHTAHASNVEMMLTDLPYDLCVNCHGKDGMTDDAGKPLTNFKSLIANSFMQHGPVENHDCSACHFTHGGENFCMLLSDYPAQFYAPYEAQNYDLCFSCHENDVFETEKTTTLTGFRDGDQNLHYLHVNKDRRGRSCRSCHEVHASPQAHLVRDGVPYGSSGWVLKINFTKTETGGSCAKTCHPTKPYNRERSNF